MPVCASCGQENPDIARFCLACAAPLAGPAAPRETRKVVTVVFCDLAGSTALGERLDPEALRAVLGRYFATVSGALRRHGGTVEKFIGDAVMCVFGIPRVHEDDALRAVRAAWEMNEELARLNDELQAEWDVRLSVRTGVNTGVVVAGDPASGQALVTGDTVNTAARLEQAAGAGQVLIGALTHELVRDRVRAEPLKPLALKGKAEAVAAWRLVGLADQAPTRGRRAVVALQGRQRELTTLREAFAETVSTERLRVVTVLGAAGLGKSRLAEEFLGSVAGQASILRAHCPAYGESMTLLPVRELLEQATDTEPGGGAVDEERLQRLMDGHPHGDRMAQILATALSGGELGAIQEAFWALEECLAHLAARGPLVVVFEDVHWAAPTLLDFLERLGARGRTAPLLVLCMTRPDLLEDRPAWAAPKAGMRVLELEPLAGEDAQALLEAAAGPVELSPDTTARILRAAEGNPLYLEQMAALLAERAGGGEGDLVVPPSIQALLAARIDRLPSAERAVAERGSVVGREFWRRAVSELSPAAEQPAVSEHLHKLVRGRLIAGGAPDAEGEELYSFRHVLLRDAAYEAMPKGLRAELHERYADWLATRPDAGERDETLGYHLEQAHRYRAELRPGGLADLELAERAAGHLAAAGRRALARCDYPAGSDLLGRAVDLLPPEHPERLAVLPALGDAYFWLGRYPEAAARLDEALRAVDPAVDPPTFARALLVKANVDLCLGTGTAAAMRDGAVRALGLLEGLDDERGIALAQLRLGQAALVAGQAESALPPLEAALAHARRAGDRERETIVLSHLACGRLEGAEPLPRAIAWCEQLLDRDPGDDLVFTSIGLELSIMLAQSGRFDEARAIVARRLRSLNEIGFLMLVPVQRMGSGLVELLAGEWRAAEREASAAYDELETMGDQLGLPTAALLRAEALLALGDTDRAEADARRAARMVGADVVVDQAEWRRVLALTLARGGKLGDAERLAREAVDIAGTTEWVTYHADSLMALASVLRIAGGPEARTAARAAHTLYEAKGHLVGAARARALLEAP